MRFVCLGCWDQAMFDALPDSEKATIMDRCFEYDDELRRGGHFVGGMALQPANEAVTLHLRDGKPTPVDGPFAETKEYIGGLLFLEARDMKQAVELISKHPGLNVGPFEIRPDNPEITALVAARDRKIAAEKKS
ncbi:YciI family protein [Anatilimnocola floriformis]|uniref:YciI family protein n=1 Tax=Anatilimnocola floriformis TaxID=2948575 RepID=UPI0020C255D5|nr:YciI family protein [Anatilimnocola floriformis]